MTKLQAIDRFESLMSQVPEDIVGLWVCINYSNYDIVGKLNSRTFDISIFDTDIDRLWLVAVSDHDLDISSQGYSYGANDKRYIIE